MTKTYIYYRLAGVLFISGGLIAVPPDLLIEPPLPRTILLLPLLAIVTGAICWAVSKRAPAWGLHVVCVVATLEVSLTIAEASRIFTAYYVLVAIFIAYGISERRALMAQVAFLVASAAIVLLYDPETFRQNLPLALVLIPVLIVVAGMIAYLRERLTASQERYRALSESDPLTGVGNYRMLTNRVPREILRHMRHQRPLALLAIDLDRFKQINDVHGHHRGDEVLRSVADALVQNVRNHDVVVRQGGDEFAVVAPETGPEEAAALAGRLQTAVADLGIDEMRLGASVGLAYFPADAITLDDLLVVADRNLRKAKVESRDAGYVRHAPAQVGGRR